MRRSSLGTALLGPQCATLAADVAVAAMLRKGLVPRMSRVGVVLVAACCSLSLLYLLACNPHLDKSQASLPRVTTGKGGYQALLQEHEEQQRHYINSLKKQISQLKEALQERSEQLKRVQDSLERTAGAPPVGLLDGVAEKNHADLQEFFRSQLDRAEVHSGVKLPSEFAVVPFESFTLQKVCQLEMGLTRHPEEKPFRKDRRDELSNTVETAVQALNTPRDGDNPQEQKVYTPSDFIEGESFMNPQASLCSSVLFELL